MDRRVFSQTDSGCQRQHQHLTRQGLVETMQVPIDISYCFFWVILSPPLNSM